MATRNIPNQGLIRQVNRGDSFGELWGTFGIDLETTPGKIKTARRLDATASSTKMNNDEIRTINIFNGNVEVFAGGDRRLTLAAERNPRISGNWAATSGTTYDKIGQETDSVVFNNLLLVSGNNDIGSLNTAGTFDKDYWTTILSGTITNANAPHIMEVVKSGQETLFVTDGNLVRYYNSTAGHTTFTLNSQHVACALTKSLDRVWAGTYTNDGKALVYELAVGNNVANEAYEVDGSAVLSMATIDNTPYLVTDKGHVQRFNGVGFVTIASFPFAFKSVVIDGCFPGDIKQSNIERAIHPKGMKAKDNMLFILVNTHNELIDQLAANPTDDDDIFTNVVVDERSPSGIWACNTDNGNLYHRAPLNHGADSKGYHELIESSPLFILDNQYSFFLSGGRCETDATELFAEATSGNYGYFITPEYSVNSITESFEKVVLKAKTLAAGESITVKYRTSKKADYPLFADITWLNGTQFTTTDDLSGVTDIGDEVEILSGVGAGKTAHITDIDGTTTYTVTLDEDLGASLNDTSSVRIQNWTKIDETMTSDDGEQKTIGINQTAPWIQFKVILDGDIELREFIVKGNTSDEL